MRHPILHLTRGVLGPALDEARAMHNAFTDDGPQPGKEIARSLGDLSHNVFGPAEGVPSGLTAEPGELLFVDHWAAFEGMEAFFANPSAQRAGDGLYSSREEMEWAVIPDGFAFSVPAPYGRPPRYLTLTRVAIRSVEEATTVVGKLVSANLPVARRRGQLSHALFVRHADLAAQRPAANALRAAGQAVIQSRAPQEILALDWWSILDGLQEHYGDPVTLAVLDHVVTGSVKTTVWQQESDFVEW